ncbi:MAG: lysophospholipid acyltransferase family protein [Planctomycetaceae bacterium]|nr:lysophospholipid acyltransferase family protein [Planctomycetaceae bacterium]
MFFRVIDYFVCLVVRLLMCLVQSLSMETALSIGNALAWTVTYLIPVRRGTLKENFDIAFPGLSPKDRRKLTFRMWQHLMTMAVEVAHASRKIHPTNWRHYIRLIHAEKVGKILHLERPVLIVTGHFGNFEAGGYFLGILGYPTYSVARQLDNIYLEEYVKNFRESSGQYLVPKNDGYDQILEVLDRKDTMAFLADQSAGPKGCWVDFFGHPASTYKAMALLSLQYDAPIVVCHSTRRDAPLQFDVEIAGILDPRNLPENIRSVKGITQWFTSLLEEGIRKKPEQYWWIHRRWKTYGKAFPKKNAL